MADINKLKDKIKSTIYPNGKGAINASDHQAMLLDMADGMAETDTKLATLSVETDARFNESAEKTSEQIKTLEDKADRKFTSVDSEIENLKRGEAYVMNESLVFRNYADAKIVGNTLTL